jgi:hypothetical protein
LGDISPTGLTAPHVFGEPAPPRTLWRYEEEWKIEESGAYPEGAEEDLSLSGYTEFQDSKLGQAVYIPQLGFGSKPQVDSRKIMTTQIPIVKPGRAKRVGGPTGQDVGGMSIFDWLHGGKHFLGKGTKPTTTGSDVVFGIQPGPGKPVRWSFHTLPDDEKEREKIKDKMQEDAEKVLAAKRKSYENLKSFYQDRAVFIKKYRSSLK